MKSAQRGCVATQSKRTEDGGRRELVEGGGEVAEREAARAGNLPSTSSRSQGLATFPQV
jgi:hypothetical protein